MIVIREKTSETLKLLSKRFLNPTLYQYPRNTKNGTNGAHQCARDKWYARDGGHSIYLNANLNTSSTSNYLCASLPVRVARTPAVANIRQVIREEIFRPEKEI